MATSGHLVISDCSMSICCVSLATSPLRSGGSENIDQCCSGVVGQTKQICCRIIIHSTQHMGLGSFTKITVFQKSVRNLLMSVFNRKLLGLLSLLFLLSLVPRGQVW